MSTVTLKNIYKIYDGDVTAVKDFNLEIADKEFIVLVGPSGCGKSTTLRMVAGLEEISKGELYIDDKCVNEVEPKDRDIAMVFQSYNLWPHMTIYENLAFGLKLRKIPQRQIEEDIKNMLKLVSMSGCEKKYPSQLSGGQQQRVAIARALASEAPIILADEPTGSLDSENEEKIVELLLSLAHERDYVVIMVTHNRQIAERADVRLVMKDGRMTMEQ